MSLNLIPLKVPDVSLTNNIALSAATDDISVLASDEVSVLLSPGETSELLVQLANQIDQPLAFRVTLSGNIPDQWCLTPAETYALPALSVQEIAIAFQVPSDFFETLTDVDPGTRRSLNYSGRIDIYSYTQTGDLEAISSERFALAVRPQSTYLQLLPQIYQEIDLAGRMMAIVEQTFSPDVETWASLWAYLDPLLAPQAMLPFLAHWVGWRDLPHLTWSQQRRLIHRAIDLYTWRGTVYGLRLYLHLVTGLPLDADDTPPLQKHITVTEPSRQGAVFGDSAFSNQTVFGGGQGFHFVVVLRCPDEIDVDETLIRAIIDQERPAFCTYELYILPML
ncbi:MAG: phage tail protein [Pseudomonadota bacterium]